MPANNEWRTHPATGGLPHVRLQRNEEWEEHGPGFGGVDDRKLKLNHTDPKDAADATNLLVACAVARGIYPEG